MKRAWIAVGLCAAAALLLSILAREQGSGAPSTTPALPERERESAHATESAPPPEPIQSTEGSASALVESVAEVARNAPQLQNLAAGAARDYRERARFPPWSRPLKSEQDPLVEARKVVPGRSFPHDRFPVLEVEPASSHFVAPDSVPVVARLVGVDGLESARSLEAQVFDAQNESVSSLEFRAEENHYEAELEATALRGAYRVEVRAVTQDGEKRSASAGFLYSVPGAVLSGRYRDAIVGGDLQIEAELEVFTSSRFHLEAILADESGEELLAWAQAARSLEPGVYWFPIDFYGLALSEKGRDGPYLLRSLALTTVDGIPNQKSLLERATHLTRPYRAVDFRNEPFDDPALLRAAQQLNGLDGLDGLE